MLCKSIFKLVILVIFSSVSVAQQLAPDFSGINIHDDKEVHLADYRGKVVLVDFWASWCPPCLLSLPAYEKMRNEIGSLEFEIIAINVDEDTADGIEFLRDHPVTYPVLADPEGVIGIPYRVRSLPIAYLLDRSGHITQIYRNFKPGDEVVIKKAIEALLGK